MALNVGDAILTFRGDLTQLNLAFDEAANSASKLAPAQATIDGVGASFDRVATQAEVAAASMKAAGETGQQAGTQISAAWQNVARATVTNAAAQKELYAALFAVKATGGESAAALDRYALALQNAATSTEELTAARKAATVSTEQLVVAEESATVSTAALNREFSMQEAKGSLALISEEMGVKIPRHIRGFIADMPGVGQALNAAFSAVALFVVVQLLVEATQKLTEFIGATFIYTEANKAAYKAQVDVNNAILEQVNKLKELKDAYELIGVSGTSKTIIEFQRLTTEVNKNVKALQDARDAAAFYSKGFADDTVSPEEIAKRIAAANLEIARLGPLVAAQQQQQANIQKTYEDESLAETITHGEARITVEKTIGEATIGVLQANSKLHLALTRASFYDQVQAQAGFDQELYELSVKTLHDQAANLAKDPTKNLDRIKELNAQIEALEDQHKAKLLASAADLYARVAVLQRTIEQPAVIVPATEIALTPAGKAIKDLEDALKSLGITGSATWAGQVADATAAYHQIKASADATTSDILQAYEKMLIAQKAFALSTQNRSAADAYDKELQTVRAELVKLGIETDKTHDKTLKMGLGYNTAGAALDKFAEKLRDQHKELTQTQSTFDDVLGSVTGAFGKSVEAAILGTDSLGHALEASLAQEAATIASKSAMYALYWAAWGIADMFWNPGRSAADFAASAEFAVIAGVAGVFARTINPKTATTGSATTGSTSPAATAATTGTVNPVQVANVQSFARGGLVTEPTLAMIGDSIAGGTRASTAGAKEIVWPLEDPKASAAIARAVAGAGGGGGSIQVFVQGLISPDNLAKVVKDINRKVKGNQLHLASSASLRVNKRSQ